MVSDMQRRLTFNVLYTPGTAEPLRRFVPSWLQHTDARFRLVANGCAGAEDRMLQRLAATSDRLSFHRLPTKEMIPHGEALSQLHALDDPEFFCFMDSDIFATGDFVAELSAHLEGALAFFSGSPIWAVKTDQISPAGVRFCGPHNRNANGLALGSSYFAVYRNRELRRCMEETGVTFGKITRFKRLKKPVKEILERLECVAEAYEAGKLINILLQRNGGSIAYSDLPSLVHVGGLSLLAYRQHVGDGYVTIDEGGISFENDFNQEIRPWIPRKRLTCHYISHHLAALLCDEPYSEALLVEEPEVRDRVLSTVEQMRGLINADRDWFRKLDAKSWASAAWDTLLRRNRFQDS